MQILIHWNNYNHSKSEQFSKQYTTISNLKFHAEEIGISHGNENVYKNKPLICILNFKKIFEIQAEPTPIGISTIAKNYTTRPPEKPPTRRLLVQIYDTKVKSRILDCAKEQGILTWRSAQTLVQIRSKLP